MSYESIMLLLDLFCGCGGFTQGFRQVSNAFSIVLGVDQDSYALNAYQMNFPRTKTLECDIRSLHSLELLEQLNHQYPDIILASPPCEAFSGANPKRLSRGYNQLFEDERGRLVLDAIRLIIDLEPRVFLIENVSQLASSTLQALIRYEFRHSPYPVIYFNRLEAVNHGVPSFRKRVFISNVPFNSTQETPIVTVRDAFTDFPDPLDDLYQETIPIPFKMAKKLIKLHPGGALVYFKGSRNSTLRNFIRLDWEHPSPTVMGKSRFIHPSESRFCTIREHARLMSFPDSFHFSGPIEQQYNQIGESVPPTLSSFLAKQILKESL